MVEGTGADADCQHRNAGYSSGRLTAENLPQPTGKLISNRSLGGTATLVEELHVTLIPHALTSRISLGHRQR